MPIERLHRLGRLLQVTRGAHRIEDGVDLTADLDRDDVGFLLREAEDVRPLPPRGSGDQATVSGSLQRSCASPGGSSRYQGTR
jgi:hypothetical protein